MTSKGKRDTGLSAFHSIMLSCARWIFRPGVKFCVSDIRQKSRMALENRANSGLDPLITESHVGQNGMRAGTA